MNLSRRQTPAARRRCQKYARSEAFDAKKKGRM
jgi:hypothetical protein